MLTRNRIIGMIGGHHKNGNASSNRYASAKGDMTAQIYVWNQNAGGGPSTEIGTTMFPDGSAKIIVIRDGIVIYDVSVAPEVLSAIDQINGVKEVDVKTQPQP